MRFGINYWVIDVRKQGLGSGEWSDLHDMKSGSVAPCCLRMLISVAHYHQQTVLSWCGTLQKLAESIQKPRVNGSVWLPLCTPS